MRQRPDRAAARPAAPPTPAPATLSPVSSPAWTDASPHTKVLLVTFRDDQAPDSHPDLAPLIEAGWRVKSAVPRLLELEGPRLLVVLTPPVAALKGPASGTP